MVPAVTGSFWEATAFSEAKGGPAERTPGGSRERSPADRPSLSGDATVDVAIVGAGYTGLWTAYYLARAEPGLRIAVVEAEHAGFGASGRNGGWCSALLPMSGTAVARVHGPLAAAALRCAMNDTVEEVGRIAEAEDIDCHYARGGMISLARTAAQERRARADGDLWLDAEAAVAICGATGVRGATFDPHCAALHP
ncbi:MAG: FAD-dependent oxidoreductase, partial [Streptomycetaceae bacterium]|nr:FAD-dependent oxidoreductase [Streptomycetaceae bacterium]